MPQTKQLADMAYLQASWNSLSQDKGEIASKFYAELVQKYQEKGRHYHNLKHIEALLRYVEQYASRLENPDTLRWAIWYHDAIYRATRQDNEEKSAELAQKRLTELGLPQAVVETCFRLIIATKTHRLPPGMNDFDAQFLLDIDLSILAAPNEIYCAYTAQIRKEYRIFPNFMYNKGRKKVLAHFLEMERIYLTDLFFELFEEKARANLQSELAQFQA